MRFSPLTNGDVQAVRKFIENSFPHDRVGIVLEEKLRGSNGSRPGTTLVAWEGSDPIGLVAMAGRWIKLLAVDPARRDRGVGRKLVELARNWVRQRAGGGRLRLMDHPGNYLSPGIDERQREAAQWLEAHGFRVVSHNLNLRVPLEGNPRVTEERRVELCERALGQGYVIRRVEKYQREVLLKMVGDTFASAWAFEVGLAMERTPPSAFAAWRDEQPVAFAVCDGNNGGLGWFGPAGTLVQHRGKKLGEALLLECLLAARGLPEGGIIAWIGPREFYERAVGAVEDRHFLVYEETG